MRAVVADLRYIIAHEVSLIPFLPDRLKPVHGWVVRKIAGYDNMPWLKK